MGLDLYTHMAGGGGIPLRAWPVDLVPPLTSGSMSIPATFEIEIENCTSFVGFSYRTGGWNPHVETVRELVADPTLSYENSTLARLYERFQPRTLQEIFIEDEPAPIKPLHSLPATRRLYRYVWALSPLRIRGVSTAAQPEGHHYFGPQDTDGGLKQFNRLRAVLESIQTHGFDPAMFGTILGYFLTNGTDYRFVVGSGNHRIAILKVLGGQNTVPASLNRSHPAVIPEARLDSWSTEAGGPFEPGTAQALFEKLFNEDGLRKARNLGLVLS